MRKGGREGNIVKDVGYGARGKKRRAREGTGASQGGRTMTDAISPKILRRLTAAPLLLCWPWIKPFDRRRGGGGGKQTGEWEGAAALPPQTPHCQIGNDRLRALHPPTEEIGLGFVHPWDRGLMRASQLFREIARSRSPSVFLPLPNSGVRFRKSDCDRLASCAVYTGPQSAATSSAQPRETSDATCFISRGRRRRPCCRTS